MLSIGLSTVAYGGYSTLDGESAPVGEATGEGLGFQKVGKDTGVGCKACEGEAEMFIDDENFLLVGREFFSVTLWCGMRLVKAVERGLWFLK
jgi:hypothetical protein